MLRLQILEPISNEISNEILIFLKQYWEKELGAKVVLKKFVFRTSSQVYSLDGIIVLPKHKDIRKKQYHRLIAEIREVQERDISEIPRELEIVGLKLLLWNRAVPFSQYLQAKKFLQLNTRIDKMLLVVSQASWSLRRYCEMDKNILMLEYGEIISFLRARGYDIANNTSGGRRMRRGRREIVRGLYSLVPLRDYHFAYIQKGLELLEKDLRQREHIAAANFVANLRQYLREYFSYLLKMTKAMRRHILNHSFAEMDDIRVREPPRPNVFIDPNYEGNPLVYKHVKVKIDMEEDEE